MRTVRVEKGFSIRARFGADVEAVEVDLDGTVAKTEEPQQLAWDQAVSLHLEGASFVGDHQELLVKAHSHIEICFRGGNFNVFAPGLFEILRETLPPAIQTSLECDQYLSQMRADILNQMLRSGEIELVKGARNLLRSLRAANVRRGLYTSSPRPVAMSTLLHLFGRADLDKLLPQPYRLFGDQVAHKKPNPSGWIQLARTMSVAPQRCVVLEDRPSSIAEALDAGFAGAVGVVGTVPLAEWRDLGRFGNRIALVDSLQRVVA